MSKLGSWSTCLVAAVVLILLGCSDNPPILIGFSGQLTGAYADLSVQGRNGALLAVEEINSAGGIDGRPLELVVEDDKGTPEGAVQADARLINLGVVAIVGHMTSSQTVAAVSQANQNKTLLFSPTTSTSVLTGIDDYFFRVQPVISLAAHRLASLSAEQGIEVMALVMDEDNSAYVHAFRKAFIEVFSADANREVIPFTFSSSEKPSFREIASEVIHRAQGVTIVASAHDASLILQKLHLLGWDSPTYSSGWAQTDTLLQNSGRAAEGLTLIADYDANNQSASYLKFKETYLDRFGRVPSFASAQAYETVKILGAALEKVGGRWEELPRTITSLKSFDSLVGPITIDAYGDVIRPQYLIRVEDGRFVTIGVIN